jgi:hypothetical protein
MSELHSRIRTVADQFAKAVVSAIRGMTLEQLVELVGGKQAVVPKRTAPKRRARAAKAAAKPKRKITSSPALRAARKIQGQYIGLMRKLSPKEKQRIQAIARTKSVAAAVAEMKKRLGRT